MTEEAPLSELPEGQDPDDPDLQGVLHGPLKALCEREVREAYGERATIVRPGLLVGPGDPRGQFTYWPLRIREGGEVLAPGTPDDPVQFVDARDLGSWIVQLVADSVFGVFHATGPAEPLSMGAFLDACARTTEADASWTWVPAEFLAEQGLSPWWSLPLWVPPTGPTAGFCRLDISRALARGLRLRPLRETVQDTLEWYEAVGAPELRFGLSREREREVLDAWQERRGG